MDKNLQKALASVQALIDEKNENINALTALVSELKDELIVTKRKLQESQERLSETCYAYFSHSDDYQNVIRNLGQILTDDVCREYNLCFVTSDGECFYPSELPSEDEIFDNMFSDED